VVRDEKWKLRFSKTGEKREKRLSRLLRLLLCMSVSVYCVRARSDDLHTEVKLRDSILKPGRSLRGVLQEPPHVCSGRPTHLYLYTYLELHVTGNAGSLTQDLSARI